MVSWFSDEFLKIEKFKVWVSPSRLKSKGHHFGPSWQKALFNFQSWNLREVGVGGEEEDEVGARHLLAGVGVNLVVETSSSLTNQPPFASRRGPKLVHELTFSSPRRHPRLTTPFSLNQPRLNKEKDVIILVIKILFKKKA
ncbi:hypothetical protein QVD17_11105 [Tagetes erecta]|uniref:Uncharacterized protein n=1 Tax=Tagetes erecta TaxID=13708 RepID=A0AAD8L7M1_TARER|nr:hypothetical protein QVD17_11105 [Tagetes erecta]